MLAVLLLVLRVADWGVRRANRLPPPPQTNGYLRLVQLGASFQRPSVDLLELKPAEITAMARTNAAAVLEAHTLLNGPVQVPLETTSAWSNLHNDQLKQLKRLGLFLALQSKAYLLAGRTNESVEYEMDMVRLGQGMTRGGVLVDGLSGLALELIGGAGLRAKAAHLDAATCRRLAQALETCEARRESADRILRNQTRWAHATFGLISELGSLMSQRSTAERHRDFQTRHSDASRRTRRLALLLAARAFQLENGRPPARPADLVPGILKAVPLDPATGKPIPDVPIQAE